ncbi:MAG: ribonuclease H-like domain-containing protein [Methanosarcinaceae archaeon]|nr:ribonuclease H-like domain-containing protein [Methanosarcinaceae archaeon]
MRTIVSAKEEETFIWVKVRDDKGTHFESVPFYNYIFIHQSDVGLIPEKSYQWISNVSDSQVFPGYTGLFLNNNTDRGLLRWSLENAGITVYEGDVNAVKRYLTCNPGLDLESQGLKWVMYDIETKDDGLFESDDRGVIIAREPILCIAYKDCDGNVLYLKNNNLDDIYSGECDLLLLHKKVIEQYDICSAWNGKKFDDAYIRQRCELHNISVLFLDYINKMDYMEIIKKNVLGLPSYSLDNVCREILNMGKLGGITAGNGNIFRAWVESFSGDTLLQKYNEQDVELMFQLEQKLNMFGLHKKAAQIAHCLIQDTMNNSDVCDYMVLNKCRERGVISPSKPTIDESAERRKEKILGAEVFCDNPGVHDNVFVLDFKSFYPSTIAMCNICSTTLLSRREPGCVVIPANSLYRSGEMVESGEKYFSNNIQGVVSDVARGLILERDKVKYDKFQYIKSDPDRFREMQLYEKAIKTIANSLYGALAFVNFRWYNFDVASAVTQFAREIINRSRHFAEGMGYVVVQGDTDSIMFKGSDHKVLEDALKVQFDIWAQEMGIREHMIVFEWEKTFHRMISIMKKNYAAIEELVDGAGVPTGDFKVSITGLECIRKDTNPLASTMQRGMIEDILYDRFDYDVFLGGVRLIAEQIKTNTLDSGHLVMTKNFVKPIGEYGRAMIDSKTGAPKINKDGEVRYAPIPAHIVLVKRLIAQGHEFFVGDNIQYIVKSTKPRIEAISVAEYELGSDYDKAYYWGRIITPLNKVLKVTKWDEIPKPL